MRNTRSDETFRILGIASIVSVYLVILAGGIVRSTGSGMGCPDWPRCFGNWIPPTNEAELPGNYKDEFKAKRHKKNVKLAKYLKAIGLKELGDEVLSEETDVINLQFNVKKTYIEYINRVLGMITGFLFFMSFISSFSYLKKDKSLIILSLFNLILVGIQGWIGSLVVSTDLLQWMVTIHMLISFLIIALLIYVVFRASAASSTHSNSKQWLINFCLVSCLVGSLLQVCFGTQVREAIDDISKALMHTQRELWVENLGFQFYLHRSFSWFILFINAGLVFLLNSQMRGVGAVIKLAQLIVLIVLAEMVTGILMAYLSIPAILQPVHLLLATVIFGLQFLLWLTINFRHSNLNSPPDLKFAL